MRNRAIAGVLLLGVAVVGCDRTSSEGTTEETATQEAVVAPAEPGLIEIRAGRRFGAEEEAYAFDGPASFPFSGWVKLRFVNTGREPHFLIIWDLPDATEDADAKTFEDYHREVAKPFTEYYARYRAKEFGEGEAGKQEFFNQLIGAIPEWFYSAVPLGGPGFTAPGETSETIIYLEPGNNYVMECYVRAQIQEDSFHGSHGMLRPLIVEDAPSGLEPPEADVEITLSSFELAVAGDLSAGPHTARVAVADTAERLIKHNVHLVRLEGEQTGADVAPWMDWVEEMLAPAPATFLGGAGQTVGGRESYFTFDLEPGSYAWVSEAHGAQEGMVHDFDVE